MDNISAIPYDQARDLIQDGDIVFMAKRNDLISRAIDFFTGGQFSHVNIAFWMEVDGIKRLMAVEAQGKTNRRVINLSNYVYYQKAEMHVVTPPKAWKDVDHDALSKLGQIKYGYLEAIYVGLREFLLERFNISIPTKHFSGQICSEFVASVYGLQHINLSPNALYKELMKTQKQRLVVAKQ
jgi:hypothetical protein